MEFMGSKRALFSSEDEMLEGKKAAFKLTYVYAESLAVKCALNLRIPDIIANKGPLTVEEIATELPSKNPDTDLLFRVMRFLVNKGFFTMDDSSDKYGLTAVSKWMVSGGCSMAPMFLLNNDHTFMAAWHTFHDCILRSGGDDMAFSRANGMDIWKYASSNSAFNNLFNDGMASKTPFIVEAFLSCYSRSLNSISSLVDVGGGLGLTIAEIVKSHPNITRAISLDLPHVVSSAPQHSGVDHVAGDMFVSIPRAEAIFLKSILHDWSDEDCIKILKNCRAAVPKEGGRVLIVDVVLRGKGHEGEDDGKSWNDESMGLAMDLQMKAVTIGGKERTRSEWHHILRQSGLARYNIIPLPALPSLIEAFPDSHPSA